MFSAFCAGRMLSMVGRVSRWVDALLESKALRSRVVTTRPPSKLLSADRGLLPRLRAVEYRVRCCAAGNASSVALSSPCCKQYKQLPHTFLYLFAFFLLADGLNTTGTLVYICQNDKFSFSFLQNTYLGLAQAITSTLSTFGFWYIQRYWRISTKRMFVVTNCVTILVPLWGMIGIWTQRIGFHNKWEFWAYNVVFGLFQAPYYAYSQTMMAELTPPGFDNMFFGLFGLSNRASSMIGPNVIQAIIDSSGNNWMGFPFLFALCACAALTIWFLVDVEKGRGDAVEWAKGVRAERYAEGGLVVKET
ncbi:Autophagy-related protein [Mycena kentingensis (nom. inval.)]|nr:Autophagy-related protein [Mycena kentingensis (nom. inval.)]